MHAVCLVGWSCLAMAAMAQTPPSAPAEDFAYSDRMKAIISRHEEKISSWAKTRLLIDAVLAQNSRGTSLNEIQQIDKQWMAGKKEDLAAQLQANPTGQFLQQKITSNPALYTEAFLCDNQGAVVGEYPKTSDYWQGDEDKFINCFNKGDGKTFIGPIRYDASTKTISVQISVPVVWQQQTIGVLVVGLKDIP